MMRTRVNRRIAGLWSVQLISGIPETGMKIDLE